jgi:hypothetical protein
MPQPFKLLGVNLMMNEFRDRPTIPLQIAQQGTGKSAPRKRTEAVIAMRLLTERQVSAITAVPTGTLRRWRCVGVGPPYIKMGTGPKARVKYDSVDIHAYVEAGRRFPSIRAGNTGGEKHGRT